MRPSCKRMPTKPCMMVEAGADHWSPWCTCIVVTTCCSGFASIQLSMSGDGKRLNPRTSKSILFLHGCHNLYFRRNHVADVFCSFRRNHIADCILIFSSISCRQCILMTFLDMETMQENFYYLKMHRWFVSYLICMFQDSVPAGSLKWSILV